MADIFGAPESKLQLNTKWRIGNFVSGPVTNKTYQMGQNFDKDDLIELNKIVREIETSSTKHIQEYDKLYKEMMLKRKVMEEELAEFRKTADGEVVNLIHKTDLDILNAQLKIIDSKQKAMQEKFRAIRDERKFFLDKQKATGNALPDNPMVSVQQLNSPLAYQGGGSAVKPVVSEIQADAISIETSADTKSVPIKSDINNLNVQTVAEINQRNTALSSERLQKLREGSLAGGPDNRGIDFSRSLENIKARDLDSTEVMYIDKSTGKFWIRSYVPDEEGVLEDNSSYVYPPIGLVNPSNGTLQFNSSDRTVKATLQDKRFQYELMDDDTQMPWNYRKQWEDPASDSYTLEEGTLQILESK